jgi:peptidylprolyl isomerase
VGGRRCLVISPHLAYGAAGVPGVIPPNTVVIMEVELLDVQGPTIAA